MAFVAWIVIRMARALTATLRLVTNRRAMRSLPWSYLRRLPRKSVSMAIASSAVAVGAVAIFLTAVLPAELASATYAIGLISLGIGIVGSWCRALAQRRKLRAG